jgi:aldehyde:ferredoxin oxidoreductase
LPWTAGKITAKDTGNIDLSWGNADSVIKLLPMIAYRQGFGELLADGSFRASKHIPGSEACLRVTKGMEVSALYLGPGMNVVQSLAYATSTRGADHLRGGVLLTAIGLPRLKETLGGADAVLRLLSEPRSIKGKGMLLALDQDFSAMINSLEICYFIIGKLQQGLMPDDLAELLTNATGIEYSGDELMKIGERIFNIERMFNIREGMGRKDDTLPGIFFEEKDTPWGPTGINKAEFQEMLDEYYSFRGWDEEGIPTKEKLWELGLNDIALLNV